MSVFTLRSSTALIALTVSLAAFAPLTPSPARAQDTAVTAPPIAETAQPEQVSRFGVDFALPPGMTVTRDAATTYAVADLDDAGVGARIGLRVLSPDILALAPPAGTPEYTAFLSDQMDMPVTDSGIVVQVGARALHLFRGTGTTPGADGTPLETTLLLMVTQEADEDGTGLMIAVFSAGLGAEVAGALELDFITSLRASEPVEEATVDTPDDGASDDTADAPTTAQVDSTEPDAAAEADATPEPPTAIASADAPVVEPALPETEVADAGTDEAAAAASVPMDSPRDSIELIAGLASVAVAPDQVANETLRNPRAVFLYLADAETPTVPTARIAAGELSRPVEQQVQRLLAGIDAVVEADVGGQPVWVIYGPASRGLSDESASAEDGIPARVIAPRRCVDGRPAYLVALMAAPGNEAELDTLQDSLTLAVPEGSTLCDDAVIAPVRAAIAPEMSEQAPQVAQTPDAMPGALPPGWVQRERFGLSFAVPDTMTVRRERDEVDRMELWLQARDAADDIAQEVSIRIFSPEALQRVPHPSPRDPEFPAMLSDFANMPLSATGETLTLSTSTLHVFRGTEIDEGVETQMVYLIADAPNGVGLTPWIALRSVGQGAESAAAFEAAFLASLSGSPELPDGVSLPPVQAEPTAQPQMPPAEGGKDPVATAEPAPETTPPAAIVTPPARDASPEAQAWQFAQSEQSVETMQAYLMGFPRSLNSRLAREWLRERGVTPFDEVAAEPMPQVSEPRPMTPPVLTETQAWAAALGQGRPEAIWTFLKLWPNGVFAAQARGLVAYQEPVHAPGAIPYSPAPAPAAPGK
ncbi:hypothetical protein [Pararhodobacter zhoushanensis]|uniref:Uncharacterized protein n=1 Tax=Pararhodobacter zhoushanensis TaxID=2479545 RepID=A0ABT3GT45_9RHOB|nr:hypothetical protein [Pararhodobacter zhoushanensis]MCW1930722.1 hypothetical protein [Pararhodobacter zhoushanensis]